MKGFVAGVLLTFVVVFGGAYFYLTTGKFPVGADNPPTTVEKFVAHRSMDNYVEAHAPKQKNPIAITNENLLAGARDYETNCAYCHGGAQQRVSPLRQKFNPPVPQLVSRPPHDEDASLFWVTKHGIRMSGMPSWDGILSDEQIWRIVAFIKNSGSLPPQVQSGWQQAPGSTNPSTGANAPGASVTAPTTR